MDFSSRNIQILTGSWRPRLKTAFGNIYGLNDLADKRLEDVIQKLNRGEDIMEDIRDMINDKDNFTLAQNY